MKEEIGKTLIPALDAAAKAFLPILQAVSKWIQDNPELAKAVVLVVGAVAGLVAILGTLVVTLASVSVSLGVLGLSLAAGGVLFLGITAISGALVMFIHDWETVKRVGGDAVEYIVTWMRELVALIELAVLKLKSLKDAANAAASVVLHPAQTGMNLGKSIVGRATGGFVNEPLTLVGEGGPELVSLPRGSYVHTAGETEKMTGNMTLNMGPFYISKEVDADGVIQQITRAIQLHSLAA